MGDASANERLKNWHHHQGPAICYSGYRAGQDPRLGIFPTQAEVLEDLRLLTPFWRYLRLYDCGQHAEIVLNVIAEHQLPFQVMLGADMAAEESNPNCPWGAHFDEEQLAVNRRANDEQIERMIALASRYSEQVFSVSIGNEASVDWTDHLVPVQRLIEQTRKVKAALPHPVTFCENYVPWTTKLAPLAAELDFISIHTYPVWEYQHIDNALNYTKANYDQVANQHPDKPVIITEAGWTTRSNGRGIEPFNANESLQQTYVTQLMHWSAQEKILTFVFEAFDESWKGSEHPDEPEKHWGLYRENRTLKPAGQAILACSELKKIA